MITGFAWIEIAARDPAAARSAWCRVLGRESLELANVALRVVEAGDAGAEGVARAVFAVEDLEAAAQLLERRGLASLAEGEVRVIQSGSGPALAIAAVAPRPAPSPSQAALVALDHLVVRTEAPDRAMALFGARLGLDLRLDRSNPAWGARLLFFRCGEAVLEVGAPLEAPAQPGSDGFGGIALRAADPAAARERLAGEGFDVSPVRAGRKPGTAVFTLRGALPGAPALVIGPAT